MLLTSFRSVEGIICEILKDGPIKTTELILRVQVEKKKVTKQAIYLALRNLKKDEVVVVHKKLISFNIRWLKNINEFVKVSEVRHSQGVSGKDNFLNLDDGEKITYSFNDANETDTFWWQALYLISETRPTSDGPVYLYNPHEWFQIARRESELESMRLVSKKRRWLVMSTNNTALDHFIVKDFDGDQTQYHMLDKQLFPKNNYYFNVIGDFLIEAFISEKFIDEIERVYQNSPVADEGAFERLKEAIKVKGKTKLSISRNKKKAEKLRKLFSKYFYIPKI